MNIYEDALINEAVDEELGISDEVSNLAMKLAVVLEDNVNKVPKTKKSPGVFYNVITFPLKNVFGSPLTIKSTNFFFGDTKIYAGFRGNNPKPNNIYSEKENMLQMNFDFINNKTFPEDFYGAFYHELKHMFQDVKRGSGYKKRPNYQTAAWGINNKNECIKIVSNIIYYATDRELYAFAGQAYEGIMNLNFTNGVYDNVRDAVIDTKLYNGYIKLKEGMNYLIEHENDTLLTTVLKKFGVNFHQIYEHCEWAIKEYAKYIGRVIVKAEKDIEERNVKNGASITPPESIEETLKKYNKLYVQPESKDNN